MSGPDANKVSCEPVQRPHVDTTMHFPLAICQHFLLDSLTATLGVIGISCRASFERPLVLPWNSHTTMIRAPRRAGGVAIRSRLRHELEGTARHPERREQFCVEPGLVACAGHGLD